MKKFLLATLVAVPLPAAAESFAFGEWVIHIEPSKITPIEVTAFTFDGAVRAVIKVKNGRCEVEGGASGIVLRGDCDSVTVEQKPEP